jgi:hypothetical protein
MGDGMELSKWGSRLNWIGIYFALIMAAFSFVMFLHAVWVMVSHG